MLSAAKSRFKQFAIGALFAALGASTVVIAVVDFSDFTSGTTISASEMNAKLNALKDAVNASAGTVACPANTSTRFTNNNDGTVCDGQTGLMWEIKTGTAGAPVLCITATDCPDPHDVNNQYRWSAAFGEEGPYGTLYTNFLERLNDLSTPNDGNATPCFAGHCDWRIPTIGELRSITGAPFGPAAPNCTSPCIAAGFPGPTLASTYWSSSTFAGNPDLAWIVDFVGGFVTAVSKIDGFHPRAVRGGR
jgi:hypothetical protein